MKPLALVLALCAVPCAQAAVIDFGNGPDAPILCTSSIDGIGSSISCGDGSYISQAHGDVTGLLDVTYTDVNNARSLVWWGTQYNNLFGVAWSSGSDGDSSARIELMPLNGQVVTLSSFDLGAYAFTTRGTNLTITDSLSGATLFSYAGPVGNGAVSATSFAPNVSSANGLRINWQNSAYNVGIDNITYSVSAVPEPASLALMLAGAGLVGAAARRRRG